MTSPSSARIAALYDIHGNLPALEAVLDEVQALGVDAMVIGGDVFPGPLARESLHCLQALELPTHFIRGNGDRAVIERAAGLASAGLPDGLVPLIDWHAEHLGASELEFMRSWPLTITLEPETLGAALFCHATPRDDNEMFGAQTPEARIAAAFEDVRAGIVVCGHTHRQFDRTIGRTRVLNAGSIGMPVDGHDAAWLLLDGDVHLRRTRYDRAAAAARVMASDYPRRDEFVESWLSPD